MITGSSSIGRSDEPAIDSRAGGFTVDTTNSWIEAIDHIFRDESLSLSTKLERTAAEIDRAYVGADELLRSALAAPRSAVHRLINNDYSVLLDEFRRLVDLKADADRDVYAFFVVDKGDGKDPYPVLLRGRIDQRTEKAVAGPLRSAEFLDSMAQRLGGGSYPDSVITHGRLQGFNVLEAAGSVPNALFSDFLPRVKSPTAATDGGLLFSTWGDDLLDRELDRCRILFPAETEFLDRSGMLARQTVRYFGYIYAAIHDALGHVLPVDMRDPRKDRVGFFLRGGIEETQADLNSLWAATNPTMARFMDQVFTPTERLAFPLVVVLKRVCSYVPRGFENDPQYGNMMADHDQRSGLLLYGGLRRYGAIVQKNGHLSIDRKMLVDAIDRLLDDCLRVEANIVSPERYARALADFNDTNGAFDEQGLWRIPSEIATPLRRERVSA